MRRASYPSIENIGKLKTLNEGMESDGLMDADESEYKGIRVIYYQKLDSLRPGSREMERVRWEGQNFQPLKEVQRLEEEEEEEAEE